MQTLILTNPVVGLSRPEVPPADSTLAEVSIEAFANLLAGTLVEQPPTARTELLSIPGSVAALSESVLPVRLEAIGAVQGLAEAAMMPDNGAEGGILILEVPPTVKLHDAFADSASIDLRPPADPFGWAPAASAPSMLPTSMPKAMPQSVSGRLENELPTHDFSEARLSRVAGESLPQGSKVDDGSPTMERLPIAVLSAWPELEDAGSDLPDAPGFGLPEHPLNGRSLPDDATVNAVGPERLAVSDASLRRAPGKDALSSAGPTMPEPVSTVPGSRTTGLPYLARDDVPVPFGDQTRLPPDHWQPPSRPVIAPVHALLATDKIPARAPVSDVVATGRTENDKATAITQTSPLLGPVLLTSAATGVAMLWQASLVAKVDDSLAADPTNVDTPASSDPRTPNPSAMLLRYEAQVAPTLRPAADFAFSLPVSAQPDGSEHDPEAGVAPAAWPSPTNGNPVAGIGHPNASFSLQDLPRLAVQLAGTHVHRADGQTEVALSPDELGHVRLSLQSDAQNPDRVVVILTFERPETLDLFRRHADQLADALRAAGYSGADISFGSSGGENTRDEPAPDRPTSAPLDTAGEAASTPAHSAPRTAATGSLDLRL